MSQAGFENVLGGVCAVCGMEGGHAEGCTRLAEAIDKEGGDDHGPTHVEVNGEKAVFNGTTGAPKQYALIDAATTDDDVLRDLAQCMEKEAAARTVANTAKNALKAAEKKRSRGGRARGCALRALAATRHEPHDRRHGARRGMSARATAAYLLAIAVVALAAFLLGMQFGYDFAIQNFDGASTAEIRS